LLFALFLGRATDGLVECGTEPLPAAAAVGCRSAHSLRCLCNTSIAWATDQSALTDGLRLAGSGQRFRPKGHRAIADMFCWLAARVALLWRCLTCAGIRRQSAEALQGGSQSLCQRLLRKGFFDGIASRSFLSLGRFSDAKV